MIRRLLAVAALIAAASAAQAESLRLCDRPAPADARQQDRLLRVAGIVKAELERSGAPAALVARSGLDLQRFGQRYSHAGVALQHAELPWSVRQLYFACDERRPRLYDQGMAGFVTGTSDVALGYVTIVVPPPEDAAALATTALDTPRALQLLGARYSANAYAFGEAFQNCNQWVAELLALAWGAGEGPPASPRGAAQQWLREAGYRPHVFSVSPLWMWAGLAVPWVHHADHPAGDVAAGRLQVSMPSSLEAFVHARAPQAERIELCHRDGRVVIRRGWAPIADGCLPVDGDTVIELD